MDIESFWEYSDPALSEERFRSALPEATGDERLELLTQIARTYSLRRRFAEAHDLLNQVESELSGAGPRPRIRYHLERGRTHHSNGETEIARRHFLDAWQLARSSGQQGLAVDAAHMLAISYSGQAEATSWNQAGLEIARHSDDPKARALIPAMLNNAAWDQFDQGNFAPALALFEEAHQQWALTGKIQQTLVARWSVARCLRSLERFELALSIQQDLETAHQAAGTEDGFVYEEIAENLYALGRSSEAGLYFAKAYHLLSQDSWLVEHETERLAGLQARAAGLSGN
jgi:tetratricopeptide (TPR) repeat protein